MLPRVYPLVIKDGGEESWPDIIQFRRVEQ